MFMGDIRRYQWQEMDKWLNKCTNEKKDFRFIIGINFSLKGTKQPQPKVLTKVF